MNDPANAPADALSLRTESDEKFLAQCRLDAFRGSGPGGQKRNKTSSSVRLTHGPSGIAAVAGEFRSQAANRSAALRRLRHRLVLQLRAAVDPQASSPPPWFLGLLDSAGRLDLSRRHACYLPTMGLILDVLEAAGWSVSDAAHLLRLSTANVVRFIQADEKLQAHVNQRRTAAGLRPLGS